MQARQDRGIALVAQILLNVNRAEHASPLTLEQVMAALGHQEEVEPEPPPTPDELRTTLSALAEMFQAKNGDSV